MGRGVGAGGHTTCMVVLNKLIENAHIVARLLQLQSFGPHVASYALEKTIADLTCGFMDVTASNDARITK